MQADIEKRRDELKRKATAIRLEPCPHCGSPAEFNVEIWGSSGEDRLSVFLGCKNFECGAQLRPNQEFPGVLEAMARRWNARCETE